MTTILAYQIVPERFTKEDAARLSTSVTSLEGGDLRIGKRNGHLTVNGAHISQTDV
jgi:uncharacterized surface protein with fasciclin (FAS1) repeats